MAGLLLLILTYITITSAANVLLLPTNMDSHTLYFARFAQAIAKEGHTSTIVLASNMKAPKWLENNDTAGIKIVYFPVEQDQPFVGGRKYSEIVTKIALSESFIDILNGWLEMDDIMNQFQYDECESLIKDVYVVDSLKQAHFDLAIVDLIGMVCQFVLPYKLDIPYGMLSLPLSGIQFRIPALPSFVPNLLHTEGDSMSFVARLKNFMMEILNLAFMPDNTTFVKKYAPDKPALSQEKLIE